MEGGETRRKEGRGVEERASLTTYSEVCSTRNLDRYQLKLGYSNLKYTGDIRNGAMRTLRVTFPDGMGHPGNSSLALREVIYV